MADDSLHGPADGPVGVARTPPPAMGQIPPPAGVPAAPEPVSGAAPAPLEVTRTRTSAAYAGIGVGLLVLVLVIVFVCQNLHQASVHFFTLRFALPEGLIVLAAAVAGGLVVLLVSLGRVVQLRLMARRHRSAGRRPVS